jgi:SAM-dependent methyltransferase
MLVSVIIPTYNHARFLSEAIDSVIAQTRPADEIIVIDDGSNDDPAAVVSRFASVRLVRQANRGRSAARNAGIRLAKSKYVVFLDADDRLLPIALETGIRCAEMNPECGFVYGAHRDIEEDGTPTVLHPVQPIAEEAYFALLRRNLVRMQASAIFKRDVLIESGGFDEALHLSEDYDLYLRIAQKYRVAYHSGLVAEYRKHGTNTSGDPVRMLSSTLSVLDKHTALGESNVFKQVAIEEGRQIWRAYYAWLMLEASRRKWPSRQATEMLANAIITAPRAVARAVLSSLGRRMLMVLPSRPARWINRARGYPDRIPVGGVHFGDFRRLRPISATFGFDRGTPIDRYYVESFLSKCAADIRGRVLEAGDDTYTRRFGGKSVDFIDIVHLDATNPQATIIGDLARSDLLPDNAFDCIILTHALHLIYDLRAVVHSLHRALKPGGILLLTVPGVSGVDDGEWGSTLAWSFTAPVAQRLFEECFDSANLTIEAYGNVFAALTFLHGIAVQEVRPDELDDRDPRYPVVVAVRAVKR